MQDDVDARRLGDAARRYTGLRRWNWRLFFGSLAIMATLALLWNHEPRHGPDIGAMLTVPLILGFLACMAGYVITWSALMGFRCPRCGGRFILSESSSWLTANCKHCDLYLG